MSNEEKDLSRLLCTGETSRVQSGLTVSPPSPEPERDDSPVDLLRAKYHRQISVIEPPRSRPIPIANVRDRDCSGVDVRVESYDSDADERSIPTVNLYGFNANCYHAFDLRNKHFKVIKINNLALGYTCKKCEFTFRTTEQCLQHYCRDHHGVDLQTNGFFFEEGAMKCIPCGLLLYSIDDFITHFKRSHMLIPISKLLYDPVHEIF